MKYRCFIGVVLSSNILTSLKNVIKPLKNELEFISNIRWVPEINYHITLHFLGSISENSLKTISAELDNFQFNKFSTQIRNLILLPSSLKPKVIAFELKSNSLNELRKSLTKKLNVEEDFNNINEYIHHITIARIKGPKTNLIPLPILKLSETKLNVDISEIGLYSSILSEQGAQYQIIKKFKSQK